MEKNEVVDWNNYLLDVCVGRMESNDNQVGGPNLIVEIDESLFVRRKNSAGRMLPQQLVFGGMWSETKEYFIVNVLNRSEITSILIINRYIRHNSVIFSDSWKAFDNFQLHGFKHNRVNHRYIFVDSNTAAHTKNVERMWGSVKWGKEKRRGPDRNFLDSNMAEFM